MSRQPDRPAARPRVLGPSRAPRAATALGALALALVCSVSVLAVAQQPGSPAQPGQPARPGQPGQPRRPPGLQRLPPGANPHAGMPMPGRRIPASQPASAPHAAEPAHAEGGHGGAHHCKGHGPEDPAHFSDINWWQGMIAPTDDPAYKAGGKASGLSRVFFRYTNPSDECDPDNKPAPFLATLLNFAIFAGLLVKFGKKPIFDALKKRKEAITADIDAAQTLREKAEARLAEYEGKFERMEETLEALRADYAQQAEIERRRVIAEATEKRSRMKRDAEFRLQQELKEARAQLLADAIDSGVEAAEALLKSRVTADDSIRLANDYLATVGALAARGVGATKKGATAPAGGAA